MYRVPRVELLLRVLTVSYILIAVLALFSRPAVNVEAIPPSGLSAAPAAVQHAALHDASVADAIVNANIFSFSRKAPARRYDPLTFDTEPAPTPSPVVTAPVVSDEDAVPKLFGIVGGPNGTAALLRLDPATPGAMLYKVGERGGAYRVEEIQEQSVVLSGPTGRVVLRLVRQES